MRYQGEVGNCALCRYTYKWGPECDTLRSTYRNENKARTAEQLHSEMNPLNCKYAHYRLKTLQIEQCRSNAEALTTFLHSNHDHAQWIQSAIVATDSGKVVIYRRTPEQSVM